MTEFFDTRAAASAATIGGGVTTIYVHRHTSGRPAWTAAYKEVADTGTLEPWQFRSNSNTRRWELSRDQRLALPMFGAAMDGATADTSAFLNAEAFLYLVGGGEVLIPTGFSYVDATISVRSSVRFVGEGEYYHHSNQTVGGLALSELGSCVIFADNLTGFEFLPADPSSPGSYTGKNSFGGGLANLSVVSKSGGTGGGSYDGVLIRNPVDIENVSVRGFERDGFHIEANNAAGSPSGNANLFTLRRVRSYFNGRDGLYVKGSDTNAGLVDRADCRNNGRYGVYDESLLGNTYIAPHLASNGGNSDWVQFWSRDNAAVAVYGGYVEIGGLIHLGSASAWIGGVGAQNICDATSSGFVMAEGVAYQGAFKHLNGRGTYDVAATLGYDDSTMAVMSWGAEPEGASLSAWKLRYITDRWNVQYANNAAYVPMQFPEASDRAFGMAFPNGLYLGGFGLGSPRHIKSASAAPVSGAWERGDLVFNNAPSAGGKVGWVCVSAGSPGTWKAFGAIDA